MSRAGLTPALLAAYRKTHYRVRAPAGDLVLRVGVHAAAFDALLTARGVATAALLTAHNPRSAVSSPAQNAAAQARLLAAISAGGWDSLAAEARDPDGVWPMEPMRAILGIEHAAARALAQAYEQNALVWIVAGAPPALMLTVAGVAAPPA